MGRKATPLAIREAMGNPARRPMPKQLKPAPAKMQPPLELCEVALAKYYELLQETHWGLVITAADNDQLCEYCKLHAAKTKAEKEIAALGEMIRTDKGNLVQNPWLSAVNRWRGDMRKIASEFGGTPSSRVKLGILAKEDDKDELSKIIG